MDAIDIPLKTFGIMYTKENESNPNLTECEFFMHLVKNATGVKPQCTSC